ncbi:ABC transporter substrate-binding protein [Cohnella abietis]|uniref:Peptide ABC transporter substrate-binding protein n=1 Tax=Cohnella abietis TaxID=2507935 RepID=A0A3T1DCQ7_9BACL|nr:ABC transporter substrate-binding protein [Cohnella abietis]BBI35910.1 peptide ABC transporter substrate-binding protein [Cohnella abietis]
MNKPQKTRFFTMLLSLMLILSLVLSACSSNEAPEASQSPSQESSDASPKASEPAAKGEPINGGKIVIAWPANPANLDPDLTTTSLTNDALSHVYEGLFEFDGKEEPVPYLAKSYEYRDDSKTLYIKLREGVKFHNGKELTSEDVEASFLRWLDVNDAGGIVEPYFDKFEIISKYEFNFKFTKPFAPFRSIIASNSANQKLLIKPKELVEKYGNEVLLEHIGTGPYEFVDWVPDRSLRLKKYKDYVPVDQEPSGYSGRRIAYVDELEFKSVPELAVRVAGVQTNEFQFANDVSLDQYANYKTDKNVVPIVSTPGFQGILAFNLGTPPFNNLDARNAVQYAVNLEELATAMVGNADFWHYNPSFFEEGTIWYDGNAGEGIYKQQDLNKAKEYLQKSGYNGTPIVILNDRGNKQHSDGAIVLKAQLEQVGFKVDVQLLDGATVSKQLADKNQVSSWNINLASFKVPKPDPQVYASWLGTDKWISHWDDELAVKMETAFEKLLVETDQTKRYALSKEVNKEFWSSLPWIRTFDYARLHLAQKSLKGFVNYSTPFYWNVWVDNQ